MVNFDTYYSFWAPHSYFYYSVISHLCMAWEL